MTCGDRVKLKGINRSLPDDIRAKGWMVAVHNDYMQDGVFHTFWLFTRGYLAIKGEGRCDADALDQIRGQLRKPVLGGIPLDKLKEQLKATDYLNEPKP